MYIICWTDNGINKWEIVNSVEAMQEKVGDLEIILQCEASEILVFDTNTEID